MSRSWSWRCQGTGDHHASQSSPRQRHRASWFAEYEPFTPVNETLRGLLTGTRIGDNLVITIAWCAGVAVLSYTWSRRRYEREPKAL